MQEPHEVGLANQFDPESCAGFRKEAGEALTGGSPGQPLSSEISTWRVPTPSCQGGGHTLSQRNQERERTGDASESQTLRMDGHSPRGHQETSAVSCGGRYQWNGRRWDGWHCQPQRGEIRQPRARADS